MYFSEPDQTADLLYKSYDEIYNRMKSEFSAKSKYDFDEASDAAIRMR